MYEVRRFSSPRSRLEPRGGKYKFWCTFPDEGDYLFKEGRTGTGENWAEVIASDIAHKIGLPCAEYFFAEWEDPETHQLREGVLTKKILSDDENLIAGNELLNILDKSYPRGQIYKVKQHTISAALAALDMAKALPPRDHPELKTGISVFEGYILFDALISNTDRHHENWSIIHNEDSQFEIAKTFDHASSLGRNESQKRKENRLLSRDKGFQVAAYCAKAKSAFYENKASNKLLTCHQAASLPLIRRNRDWLSKIASLNTKDFIDSVDMVPNNLMSEIDKTFTLKMLEENQAYLRGLL